MKLNLGCGKDYKEGYVNIDFADFSSDLTPIKVDLNIDMRKGLPFDNNSVEEVIFYECLEHFNRFDGLEILKEIYRVLKPSCVLHLSVPNSISQIKMLLAFAARQPSIEDFLNCHNDNGRFWDYWKFHDDVMGATNRTYVEGKDYGQGASHKTLWTKNQLICVLEYVGYKIISFDDKIFIKATK